MKKILLLITVLQLLYIPGILSQPAVDTEIYLLTCGPGTETYSIYGHSALRIVIPEKKFDLVYNWGLFDFDTPHFAWKFAKGRLNYMVGYTTLTNFLKEYNYEKRFVISQKINLNQEETDKLVTLLNENLKPENVEYRYDFLYDNCSTRIRDILEKSIGNKLFYPPDEVKKAVPTFREMINKYQMNTLWLDFGIDLLLGSPCDKRAFFRDRMFLPIEMHKELSKAVVNRDNKMVPLLQNPETILDFSVPGYKQNFLTSPSMVFTLFFIIVIILTSSVKRRKMTDYVDIAVLSIFSVLSLVMIFFNFFTDHQQTEMNFNILWLNPLLIICLILLIMKKPGIVWHKIVFYITLIFIALMAFLPQGFNLATVPLILLILVRSSARAGFSWNPFSLK